MAVIKDYLLSVTAPVWIFTVVTSWDVCLGARPGCFFFSLMCFYIFGFVRCLCCCFYLVHCADRGHLLPISRLLISVKIYANQRTQRRERGDASSRLMSFLMSPLPDPVAV